MRGHGASAVRDGGGDLPLPLHHRSDELRILDDLAQRVERVIGVLPDGWAEQRAAIERYRDSKRAFLPVLAHRDLHDGQFITTEQDIALLDFDCLCLGEKALDVANLIAHLSLRYLQGLSGATPESAEAAGEALLEGLDRSQERGFIKALRFYQATTFLRLALVYELRPRWWHIVPDLVTLSQRCSRDLCRC
ncbi:MAG: phosphotransferase [Planctomycetota bacterium]|jgi:thiamine kinase-like enzyme|nr:phosphotransferase [Planctomycetota bacterium]MDP6837497.1 phosphotransferase [Planctomycetota bacterium]MDP6954431.1 phosphotransferase [Planctomycetota bacterium]